MDINENKLYHISLAYRNGMKFTDDEIKLIKNLIKNKDLEVNNMTVKLYNCNSINCEEWIEINSPKGIKCLELLDCNLSYNSKNF